MPLELLTQMGPRNQVLVGAPIPSWEWAILRAHIPPHYKVLREPVVSCRKSADRSTCGSGEDSCELKELCVRWGRRSFLGKGQFECCFPIFSIEMRKTVKAALAASKRLSTMVQQTCAQGPAHHGRCALRSFRIDSPTVETITVAV